MITLLFGAALLLYNLSAEYIALNAAAGAQVTPSELPTIRAIGYRIIGTHDFDYGLAEVVNWGTVLKNQLYRIGRAAVPYFLATYEGHNVINDEDYPAVVLGGLALAICGIGLAVARIPTGCCCWSWRWPGSAGRCRCAGS